MKLCNKALSCKYHENRCEHRKLHNSDTIECYPAMRESAGLQINCMHYHDQICMEVLPTENKQAGRATKQGHPCKSEAKDIRVYQGGNKMRPKTIFGIDPGLSGAIAILRGTQLTVFDTPIIVVQIGKGTKREYAEANMADIMQDYETEQCHVFVEIAHSMPKQGVSSVFSFGMGFGIWRGIIAALKIPCTFITPQAWKAAIMQGIADKNAARLRAQQLFPAYADLFSRKKDDGRAEASLIAYYGRGQI